MKNLIWLIIISAVLCCGCSDSGSPDKVYPSYRGSWDITLLSGGTETSGYSVTVETAGGPGSAVVSITGPFIFDSATVLSDVPIEVDGCGTTITFGNTTGFNMAAGDSWTIQLINGEASAPVPGNTVDSIIGPVTSGGTYACEADYCPGSALASAVPAPSKVLNEDENQGVKWLSVFLQQEKTNVTSAIPEVHVLSLYIEAPELTGGDSVTLSYQRRVSADSADGDFFRVQAVKGPDALDVEYLRGAAITNETASIFYGFTTEPELVRIDFIAGLSAPGEYVVLDDIEISTSSGGTIVLEGFESGPSAQCGVTGAFSDKFEVRKPAWTVGNFCVSANQSLGGTYSARWDGGNYRLLSGSIITEDTSSDLLGGMDAGPGSFGGAASFLNSSGILMQVWEPNHTNYFTSFTAIQPIEGIMEGTFRGEARGGICTESGDMSGELSGEDKLKITNSLWTISVQGMQGACGPAYLTPEDEPFSYTFTSLTGDTISVTRVEDNFAATEQLIDGFGNLYDMAGSITGDTIRLFIVSDSQTSAAKGDGTIVNNSIDGSLTERLLFDSGVVCDIYGANFHVDIIEIE